MRILIYPILFLSLVSNAFAMPTDAVFFLGGKRDGISTRALPVAARSCKQVASCEEAVELWCGGYSRADADKDGIPCENICYTLEQVNDIRRRIGC